MDFKGIHEFLVYLESNLLKNFNLIFGKKSKVSKIRFFRTDEKIGLPISQYFFDYSPHFVINKVRFWNPSVKYFVSNKVNRISKIENNNRLKNVFEKILNDFSIWSEIEKLLSLSLVSLSSDNIYESEDLLIFSPLSRLF